MSSLAFSFLKFHERYSKYFFTKTRSVVEQSKGYLNGLMLAAKKNVERMIEVVPDSNYQSLHHFISESPWDHQPVMDQVAKDCDRLLGGSGDSCLIFDESAMQKKGTGVARQWSGRLGKVDNCQVGVFAALSLREDVALIDERLYLPNDWISDKKRCEKAGIPEGVGFATKSQLVFEMVLRQRANGIRFVWIGLDGGYGKDTPLLCSLDDAKEVFVADVHKDQVIYLEDPVPYLPKKKDGRGRRPERLVSAISGIRVDEWTKAQPEESWKRIVIRDSSKGKLHADFLYSRVWIWNKEEKKGRQWHLIVKREIGSRDTIKYSLSNSSEDIAIERLAYMQGQRYFVERAFQDAKSNAGLDQYQIRGWRSWHHHICMVMMTMLFMLETKISNKESHPLLSSADISGLLSHFLPRRDVTQAEVLRQMEFRHRQRQDSIDSAYARQGIKGM